MKTDIETPITSPAQAEEYLKALVANEEDYHPEDDAQDIVFDFDITDPTERERELLNLRMEEVYFFIPDPCKVILKALNLDFE